MSDTPAPAAAPGGPPQPAGQHPELAYAPGPPSGLHTPYGTLPVLVPPVTAGAAGGWRRLVTGGDPAGRGGWALQGHFLDPGLWATLPEGAVVVGVDTHRGRCTVTAHRVTATAPGHLELLHAPWRRSSSIGPREVTFVLNRLAPGSARHQVADRERLLPEAGRCDRCGQHAAAGERVLTGSGTSAVRAHRGPCPPRPAELPVNNYGGRCLHCGRWVEAGSGRAVLVDDSPTATREPAADHDADAVAELLRLAARLGAPSRGSNRRRWPTRYRAAHHTPCPPDAAPGPPTRRTEWCRRCHHRMPPGTGHWAGRTPLHTDPCPAPADDPRWVVRRRSRAAADTGTVLRLRFTPRDGEPPVPADAPGARILNRHGYTELIAVVTDCLAGPGRRTLLQVRPATWSEAADLLAGELDLALDARPAGQGFTARWIRERICGDRPWLAEITGHHPAFGFQRVFQRPMYDADPSAPRGFGVMYCWTLQANAVYETSWPGEPAKHWRDLRRRGYNGRVTGEKRAFLQVTPAGDVKEISKEEVEAWLANSPVWAAAARPGDVPGRPA